MLYLDRPRSTLIREQGGHRSIESVVCPRLDTCRQIEVRPQ
jgi:hypothetical protein